MGQTVFLRVEKSLAVSIAAVVAYIVLALAVYLLAASALVMLPF
jgi:hypothetical protein